MGLRHWQRRLATGLNAVLVAGLVVLSIQLLVDVAERTGPRWDLSADRNATLRPETLSALGRLDRDGRRLEITAFSVQQRDGLARLRDRRMADFLRELEEASDQVRVEWVDFDRDRLTAERLGVQRYGTVVLRLGEDRVDLEDRHLFLRSGTGGERTLRFVGEPALVAAIEQLLAAEERVVYTLVGHGEKRPYDRGRGELRGLAEVLATLGLRHRPLDLLDSDGPPEVPGDAAAVWILGPTAPLAPSEQEALRAWMRRGGAVILCLEPGAPMPRFVERFGLLRPEGLVMDTRSMYPWEDRPLLRPRNHPIGRGLSEAGLAVVAGGAGPVVIEPVEGVHAAALLGTGPSGWVERGRERPARYDPGVDGPGPVDVAVAAQIGRGRLVLVADLDLVADPLLDEGPGNRTFAAALLRWAVGEEPGTARLGARRPVRRVAIGPAQLTALRIGLVGLWPLTVLGLGAVVLWWRRRP